MRRREGGLSSQSYDRRSEYYYCEEECPRTVIHHGGDENHSVVSVSYHEEDARSMEQHHRANAQHRHRRDLLSGEDKEEEDTVLLYQRRMLQNRSPITLSQKIDPSPPSGVRWVHHDSPVGPAVSVYPRGYYGERNQRHEPPPYQVHPYQSSFHPQDNNIIMSRPRRRIPPPATQTAPAGIHDRIMENAERARFISGGSETHCVARSSPTPSFVKRLVEISPGVRVPLRGAMETKECVQRDFFGQTLCYACNLKPLFCIQDAAYVLCPSCRVISPFEDNGIGLGLGFTLEHLQCLREEENKKVSEFTNNT